MGWFGGACALRVGFVRSLRLPSARCSQEENRRNLKRFEVINVGAAIVVILKPFPAFSYPLLIQ